MNKHKYIYLSILIVLLAIIILKIYDWRERQNFMIKSSVETFVRIYETGEWRGFPYDNLDFYINLSESKKQKYFLNNDKVSHVIDQLLLFHNLERAFKEIQTSRKKSNKMLNYNESDEYKDALRIFLITYPESNYWEGSLFVDCLPNELIHKKDIINNTAISIHSDSIQIILNKILALKSQVVKHGKHDSSKIVILEEEYIIPSDVIYIAFVDRIINSKYSDKYKNKIQSIYKKQLIDTLKNISLYDCGQKICQNEFINFPFPLEELKEIKLGEKFFFVGFGNPDWFTDSLLTEQALKCRYIICSNYTIELIGICEYEDGYKIERHYSYLDIKVYNMWKQNLVLYQRFKSNPPPECQYMEDFIKSENNKGKQLTGDFDYKKIQEELLKKLNINFN